MEIKNGVDDFVESFPNFWLLCRRVFRGVLARWKLAIIAQWSPSQRTSFVSSWAECSVCTPPRCRESLMLVWSRLLCCVAICWSFVGIRVIEAVEWKISPGGNAYRTAPAPGNGANRRGVLTLTDKEVQYSFFFAVSRPCDVNLAFFGNGSKQDTKIDVIHNGESQKVELKKGPSVVALAGSYRIADAGYVRIDLRLAEGSEGSAEIAELIVNSDTPELKVDYVRDNEGNMFYWGRRGPSVHLSYQVPRGLNIQYAYSELTVPEGEDPIGSYYMANGFGEGYFGMQVNSPTERRVLFSVWSPFQTDNPKDIPAEQRIEVLGRGPEVTIGEFGNEGSGGQSFLIYPWVAGKTYRFLTEVKPNGKGSTVYTSWFGDKEANEWRLIASFRRPQTDTHLRGFHSFLESFNPEYGYIGRRVENGNQWVVDTDRQWHECVTARFSVDPTGGNRHRLDYNGGAEGNHFYMHNCGFFSQSGRPGESFTRESSKEMKPEIKLDELLRK